MIALLLVSMALADPAALRAPGTNQLSLVVGVPELSVGAWLKPNLGLYGSLRADLGSFEVGVAQRRRLAGEELGASVEASLGLGLQVPLVNLGIGAEVTPALSLVARGERITWSGGLVAPISAGSGGLRVPALAETWIGSRVGSGWIGLRLAAGGIFTPGFSPAFAMEAGLCVSLIKR